MKLITLLLITSLGTSICLVACFKDPSPGYNTCTGPEPSADSSALLAFAARDSMTVTRDSTGLYYQIIDSGAGPMPTSSSKIYATYQGELMDGTIFDSTTDASKTGLLLSDYIQGWQIGLPKIRQGGRIKLLIPSAYGYGCMGSSDGVIPRNAPLYFDVTLTEVQF